jgi:hypothetical protein
MGRLSVAARSEGASELARATRNDPPRIIAASTLMQRQTGTRTISQAKSRLHANSAVEANQVIANVIPQIPAIEAICMIARFPYCV